MSINSAAENQAIRLGELEQGVTATEGEVIEAQSAAASALARPGEVLPPTLHVLPVSERPFFPGQFMPVMMPADAWLETVERVGETPHKLVALLAREARGRLPPPRNKFGGAFSGNRR